MNETVRIADQTYRIVKVYPNDPPPIPEMTDDTWGYCHFHSDTIYVRVCTPTRERTIRNHEFLHAAMEASGADWVLAQAAEKLGVTEDDLEELLVRMLAPALSEVFIP